MRFKIRIDVALIQSSKGRKIHGPPRAHRLPLAKRHWRGH